MRNLVWVSGKKVITETSRDDMLCTRRQARLALGEANCAILDQAENDTNIPWAMRESIKSASEWYRNAPEIDELAWLLGLSDDGIDALFIKAMSL